MSAADFVPSTQVAEVNPVVAPTSDEVERLIFEAQEMAAARINDLTIKLVANLAASLDFKSGITEKDLLKAINEYARQCVKGGNIGLQLKSLLRTVPHEILVKAHDPEYFTRLRAPARPKSEGAVRRERASKSEGDAEGDASAEAVQE